METSTAASPARTLLRRWPAAAGLTVAILVLIFSADRETAATAVNVAVLCYLGAAAFARRWVAWAGVLGFSLVVFASEVIGLAWWVSFAVLAVVLLGVGLASGVPRRPLWAHVVAVAGYGTLGVIALYLSPTAGGVLAGLTLAAHAAWDAMLYRRDEVVPRSLTEACMALDVPLGLGVVVLALTA